MNKSEARKDLKFCLKYCQETNRVICGNFIAGEGFLEEPIDITELAIPAVAKYILANKVYAELTFPFGVEGSKAIANEGFNLVMESTGYYHFDGSRLDEEDLIEMIERIGIVI